MSKAEIKIQMPEFTKQMNRLKSIYNNTWFLSDANALETWYDALNRFTEKQITASIDRWIMSSKIEPKPIDIIDGINASGVDDHGGVKGDPLETWPIIIISTAKENRVLYECRISPNAEVVGAKKRALEYVIQIQKKVEMKEEDGKKVFEIRPYDAFDLRANYYTTKEYKERMKEIYEHK